MYDPQLDTDRPETSNASSIMINEIDLDKEDTAMWLLTDDTRAIEESNLVQYEVPQIIMLLLSTSS